MAAVVKANIKKWHSVKEIWRAACIYIQVKLGDEMNEGRVVKLKRLLTSGRTRNMKSVLISLDFSPSVEGGGLLS